MRSSHPASKRFDLREFHEQVLEDGALPLGLLEEKLDGMAGDCESAGLGVS